MSARTKTESDPSAGPKMIVKPSASGYTHATSERNPPIFVRCGATWVCAAKNSSSPAVTVTRSARIRSSDFARIALRSAERSHCRRCMASMKRNTMWYSSESFPGCSIVAPRHPGNARTVETISSDHTMNCAEQPGFTVRAMVTVTEPGAMRGSFSVSNDPVSSGTQSQ